MCLEVHMAFVHYPSRLFARSAVTKKRQATHVRLLITQSQRDDSSFLAGSTRRYLTSNYHGDAQNDSFPSAKRHTHTSPIHTRRNSYWTAKHTESAQNDASQATAEIAKIPSVAQGTEGETNVELEDNRNSSEGETPPECAQVSAYPDFATFFGSTTPRRIHVTSNALRYVLLSELGQNARELTIKCFAEWLENLAYYPAECILPDDFLLLQERAKKQTEAQSHEEVTALHWPITIRKKRIFAANDSALSRRLPLHSLQKAVVHVIPLADDFYSIKLFRAATALGLLETESLHLILEDLGRRFVGTHLIACLKGNSALHVTTAAAQEQVTNNPLDRGAYISELARSLYVARLLARKNPLLNHPDLTTMHRATALLLECYIRPYFEVSLDAAAWKAFLEIHREATLNSQKLPTAMLVKLMPKYREFNPSSDDAATYLMSETRCALNGRELDSTVPSLLMNCFKTLVADAAQTSASATRLLYFTINLFPVPRPTTHDIPSVESDVEPVKQSAQMGARPGGDKKRVFEVLAKENDTLDQPSVKQFLKSQPDLARKLMNAAKLPPSCAAFAAHIPMWLAGTNLKELRAYVQLIESLTDYVWDETRKKSAYILGQKNFAPFITSSFFRTMKSFGVEELYRRSQMPSQSLSANELLELIHCWLGVLKIDSEGRGTEITPSRYISFVNTRLPAFLRHAALNVKSAEACLSGLQLAVQSVCRQADLEGFDTIGVHSLRVIIRAYIYLLQYKECGAGENSNGVRSIILRSLTFLEALNEQSNREMAESSEIRAPTKDDSVAMTWCTAVATILQHWISYRRIDSLMFLDLLKYFARWKALLLCNENTRRTAYIALEAYLHLLTSSGQSADVYRFVDTENLPNECRHETAITCIFYAFSLAAELAYVEAKFPSAGAHEKLVGIVRQLDKNLPPITATLRNKMRPYRVKEHTKMLLPVLQDAFIHPVKSRLKELLRLKSKKEKLNRKYTPAYTLVQHTLAKQLCVTPPPLSP